MPEPGAYLLLKLSRELFHKSPDLLGLEERQKVERVAHRQLDIEQRILATPEAAQVFLSSATLEQAVAEVRGRYASENEFLSDLERAGLDAWSLSIAIERDLRFEAVLERVASNVEAVSDTDVEIFYLLHPEIFRRPENRTLRHILVTINDTLHGSDRISARRKIEAARSRLLKSPGSFARLAQKYSECPTAMDGGLLGTVQRGQLYPELEKPAFDLPLGGLSKIVESPMGFHVLECIAIESEGVLPLTAVREKIREQLSESRRRSCQKAWIASLLGNDPQPAFSGQMPHQRSAA